MASCWGILLSAVLLLVVHNHLAQGATVGRPSNAVEIEDFLENPHYHSEQELERLYADLMKRYPDRVEVLSAGKSVEGRELYVLHLNSNIRKRGLLVPMFKYVANMHGDETVGRELLIYLAEYLLYNYGQSEEVGRLMNTTDIYLMPTMNPDGYAKSRVRNEMRRNMDGKQDIILSSPTSFTRISDVIDLLCYLKCMFLCHFPSNMKSHAWED